METELQINSIFYEVFTIEEICKKILTRAMYETLQTSILFPIQMEPRLMICKEQRRSRRAEHKHTIIKKKKNLTWYLKEIQR